MYDDDDQLSRDSGSKDLKPMTAGVGNQNSQELEIMHTKTEQTSFKQRIQPASETVQIKEPQKHYQFEAAHTQPLKAFNQTEDLKYFVPPGVQAPHFEDVKQNFIKNVKQMYHTEGKPLIKKIRPSTSSIYKKASAFQGNETPQSFDQFRREEEPLNYSQKQEFANSIQDKLKMRTQFATNSAQVSPKRMLGSQASSPKRDLVFAKEGK